MNRIAEVFRMQLRDKFSWLLLPWIILGSSFAVNLLIAASQPDTLVTGGLTSIFIYYFVIGIVVPAQTFPFALGMGIRRIDYFAGTSLVSVAIGALMTVLLLILSALENSWLASWGVGLSFFDVPFFSDGPIAMRGATYLALFLLMFFSGFAIACVYRKFGRAGMYALIVLGIVVTAFTPMLISYYDLWDEIGRWVEANIHSLNDLTPWAMLFSALLALVSFGLLRRSTV